MSDELALNQIVVTVSGRSQSGKSTILYVIFDALRAAGFTDVLVSDPDLFKHGFYRQQSNRVRYLAENVKRPITLETMSLRSSQTPTPRHGERLALPEMPAADVSDTTIDVLPSPPLLSAGEPDE